MTFAAAISKLRSMLRDDKLALGPDERDAIYTILDTATEKLPFADWRGTRLP